MKNKIKLFLHIGQPKTGTSAIQSYLNYNRKKLFQECHILYPNFSSKNFPIGMMHNHAQYFMSFKLKNDMPGCINSFSNCVHFCKKHYINKLIISNEGFYWIWWPELMKEIVTTFDLDLSIILYLRRQDKWLESGWKQWGHKSSEYKTIQEYESKTNCDYNQAIAPWLKYFDKSSFIIRPYERITIGNDVVKDFINLIDIPFFQGVIPPRTAHTANDGFSRDVIEILNLCKGLVKNVNDNRLLEFMERRLPMDFKKDQMESYSFFSFEERAIIIAKYNESNVNFARFFSLEKEILFHEPISEAEEHQNPYIGLKLENVIPVFMAIALNQESEIRQLAKKVNQVTTLNKLRSFFTTGIFNKKQN